MIQKILPAGLIFYEEGSAQQVNHNDDKKTQNLPSILMLKHQPASGCGDFLPSLSSTL